MKKSIYNISSELEEIFNKIEDNEGDMDEEMSTSLTITQQELENKGIQYGFKVMSINSENEQIDAEIERLQKIKKRNVSLETKLKDILSTTMQHFGIDELKTPTLRVFFRKSESVDIEDENLIDKKYKVEETKYKVDKKLIKEALKNSEIVVGAKLNNTPKIQIK